MAKRKLTEDTPFLRTPDMYQIENDAPITEYSDKLLGIIADTAHGGIPDGANAFCSVGKEKRGTVQMQLFAVIDPETETFGDVGFRSHGCLAPLCHHGGGEAGADGQHVGVVVAAGHLRAEGLAAQGAADALDLVGGDGDTDAGGADHDAPLALPGGHRPGGRLPEVGVVAAAGVVTAEVLHLMALLLEIGDELLLQCVAAVVASDGNFHGLVLTFL